jgi:hypothetical protein
MTSESVLTWLWPWYVKKAKLTQSYVAMMEGGDKKNPSLAILRRLAKALKVRVAELVE